MQLGEWNVSESDAIRAYIITLRSEQHITQTAAAKASGLGDRAYKSWEAGDTQDIKGPPLIRLVRFLGGSFDDLESLEHADADAGRDRALAWLKIPTDQRSAARVGFRQIIELGEQDPERLRQIVERLRDDSRADPTVLDMVLAWLDGRRSFHPR